MQENHQYQELLFIPSLIPRHHSCSARVSPVHCFFHTPLSSQHQIAVFTSHSNYLISFLITTLSVLTGTLHVMLSSIHSRQLSHFIVIPEINSSASYANKQIVTDCIIMASPPPCDRTHSFFSLESFTYRSHCCNGYSVYNLMPLSRLQILPSLPHMEGTDFQQQARHAIAIIPYSILDSSEATMKN